MKNWKSTFITSDRPIIEAMEIIDSSSMQVALVVDYQMRLVGVVTDGDIRRALLKGMALSESVDAIMNRNFSVAGINSSRDEIIALMKRRDLRQIPIVDDSGCIVDLKVLFEMVQLNERENWVVIMAGGLGTRLQPLTNDTPKSMLTVGNKPLLETIIGSFVEYGFSKFFISVNYRADIIEKSIGNGCRWGVEVCYLREDRKMGTAGALGLLPERPKEALIIMNGDVLTKINFQHLIDFHRTHKAAATMCVGEYHFQIPFGVARVNEHRLTKIDEKPFQHFFV